IRGPYLQMWREELRWLYHRRGQLAQAQETSRQEKEKGKKREEKIGQKNYQGYKEDWKVVAFGQAYGR
ncbi:MAG: hypothetical protein VX704_01075, partial [Verrucomicrobiota bacterium]|nr:hypothetical protein [Verrucomicrobiota bacterium]